MHIGAAAMRMRPAQHRQRCRRCSCSSWRRSGVAAAIAGGYGCIRFACLAAVGAGSGGAAVQDHLAGAADQV